MLYKTGSFQEIIHLWSKDEIPNSKPGVSQNEAYKHEGGILRIYNVSFPTLTMYSPCKDKANGTGVMICPGGGYSFLAAGHEGEEIAKWLNEFGVTAFVLKYRLPDEKLMYEQQNVPFLDAMQAISHIRTNALKYSLNFSKIGIMGFSAGGHLASTLATHYHYGGLNASELAKPDFMILIYPVISFITNAHAETKKNLLGKLRHSKKTINYFSNELHVSNLTPPTFLVHSQNDQTVPVQNSINFYKACLVKNVPVEMHLYPFGGHGYGLRTSSFGTLNNWTDACKNWLKLQSF